MIANKAFLVLVSFLLVSCATDPVSNRSIVTMGQSLLEDEHVGEKNCLQLAPSNTRVRFDDPRAVRVQEIYYKLFAQTELKGKMLYLRKISLQNNSTVSAFTCGGGYVVVTTGLLSTVKNDDQLASVVAHELAHSAHRHVAQKIAESKLETVVSVVGAVLVAAAGGDVQAHLNNENIRRSLSDSFIKPKYSRDQEREADKTSIIYMCKAGFNPFEAAKVHTDVIPDAPEDWLNSHPSTAERVEILRNTAQTAPECSSFKKG